MRDFQRRVVDERTQLDAKLAKLGAFLQADTCAKLPQAEQDRLRRQLKAMTEYSLVLAERIDNFNQE